MGTTYKEALDKIGTSVPEHLEADAEIPVLTVEQAQGDLMIVPIDSTTATLVPVPDGGVQVVVGEDTGNTHWLHRGFDSPGVTFARVEGTGEAPSSTSVVVVSVPEGQTAELIHTDEHGANAMGPGLYAVNGKREFREEIVRVLD